MTRLVGDLQGELVLEALGFLDLENEWRYDRRMVSELAGSVMAQVM